MQKRNPDFSDILDRRWNIAAGISYDRMLWRKCMAWWKKWNSEGALFAGYPNSITSSSPLPAHRKTRQRFCRRAIDDVALQIITRPMTRTLKSIARFADAAAEVRANHRHRGKFILGNFQNNDIQFPLLGCGERDGASR
jgi:hypothetical protein